MGPEERRADEHAHGDDGHPDHILLRRDREKWHAVALHFGLVALAIGGPIDQATRHRPFVDAQPQHQPEMQGDQANQQPWDHKDMQREKARQGSAGDDRPPQEQFDHLRSDQRRPARDGGANPQPPIGILIPAQDLAGEGHAQGSEQEEHADDPGELARILVGPKEEDLDQVQGHQQHHAIRTPEVHGTEIPAKGGVVVEILQRLVMPGRRWGHRPMPGKCR